jgi:hypothetical protein
MEKVIILKEVKKSDCSFLYELLSERKSHVNISHKKIPTYAKHVKFVMSKPYSKWYVIYHTTEKIGSVYLTKQDEIGIHFKEQNMNNKIRSKVLNMIIRKNPRNRYLININPRNTSLRNFLKNEGFELIQHTYEISKKNSRVKK